MRRPPLVFITGTDTGAGKTVLTSLLARHLHQRGVRVAALKPVCSGGRADAEALHAALDSTLPLDLINPWHFRAPLAPVLAARRQRQTVTRAQLLAHIRHVAASAELTLVEGAGGLLSPLAEQCDSRDLIRALRARVILVAPNQLGVVNHLLLTLHALPAATAAATQIVLMTPARPDAATRTNAALLAEAWPGVKLVRFPWLGTHFDPARAVQQASVRRALDQLGLTPSRPTHDQP